MESTDRLDKPPPALEITGPNRSDGVGRALRRTFPPVNETPADLADLIAELDAIPVNCLDGSRFRLRP